MTIVPEPALGGLTLMIEGPLEDRGWAAGPGSWRGLAGCTSSMGLREVSSYSSHSQRMNARSAR